MEVMALLVGLDLVVTLDVFAIDLHQRAFERRAVFVFHIPFERRNLRHSRGSEKQQSRGGQSQQF